MAPDWLNRHTAAHSRLTVLATALLCAGLPWQSARADTCTWRNGSQYMYSSDATVCSQPVQQQRPPARSSLREQLRARLAAGERRPVQGDPARTNQLVRTATQQLNAGDNAGARATLGQLADSAASDNVRQAARLAIGQMDAAGLGGNGLQAVAAPPPEPAVQEATEEPPARELPMFGDDARRMEAYGRTIPPACQQAVLEMVQGQQAGNSDRAISGFMDLEARCPAVLAEMAEIAEIRLPRRFYTAAALENIRTAMGEDPGQVIAQLYRNDASAPVVAVGAKPPPADPVAVVGALVDGRNQAPSYRFNPPEVTSEDIGAVVEGFGAIAGGLISILGARGGGGYVAPSVPQRQWTPAPQRTYTPPPPTRQSTVTGLHGN